jgi:DNA modification methylase
VGVILRADARQIPLRDGCVQTCVTSPPYWGLRDYGVAGQIGLEATPAAYVATMVGVFREVKRVLRDDGTVWLNLGDSYAGSGKDGNPEEGKQATNAGSQTIGTLYGKVGETARLAAVTNVSRRFCAEGGIAPKNLTGIPWRVAFALQADGWYLRSDIIWAKPNPMPESVTDRPTRSHEYIFLLSKGERYFYDADAIREDFADERMGNPGAYTRTTQAAKGANNNRQDLGFLNGGGGWNAPRSHRGSLFTNGKTAHDKANVGQGPRYDHEGRNKRSVWTVNSEPTPEAHFATFPQKLIEPCILAGSRIDDLVLDPFIGSGTIGKVAERFGRRWVGLELSADYVEIAKQRTAQQGLGL